MARILVIDDEAAIRSLIREILEEEGHEITDAADGIQGMEAFRSAPFDLVIADMLMPGMDGVELIMELTGLSPQVRIIAISGGGRGKEASSNLELARDYGAQYLLAKPFTPRELIQAVYRSITDDTDPETPRSS
ncbi:MAG: response regulator [Magnetococcales bacterium]|nr:response regulator [Magnetococcales bacterium]